MELFFAESIESLKLSDNDFKDNFLFTIQKALVVNFMKVSFQMKLFFYLLSVLCVSLW
jgi:hypothetical protein